MKTCNQTFLKNMESQVTGFQRSQSICRHVQGAQKHETRIRQPAMHYLLNLHKIYIKFLLIRFLYPKNMK